MEDTLKHEQHIAVDPITSILCQHCGVALDVSDVDVFAEFPCPSCQNLNRRPAQLGPFRLLNLINSGGMGCVYAGKDETLGRMVAIKVMRASLGANAEFVERFKREAQAAAKLNHPNIAQIYSFGQEKGQPYIVMELISGKRLDSIMEQGRALEPAFVLQLGIQIADGLKAADEIGLIHGDIKPENILFDEKMQAKLVDFGIASFGEAEEGIWGTPYYIAPEKLQRQKPDARTDIYSLGATLYHALSGHPPFEGKTPADVVRARLQHPPKPLRKYLPQLDPQIEKIIQRMLEVQPGLRYPTYTSLMNDMNKVLEALTPAAGKLGGLPGRKIILKKKPKEPGETASGKFTITKSSFTSDLSELREQAAEQAELEEKKRRRRLWLVTVIFILLAIGAGMSFYTIRQRQADDQEAATRRQRLRAYEDKAQEARKLRDELQGVSKNISAGFIPVHAHLMQLGELTLGILNESLEEAAAKAGPIVSNPVAVVAGSVEDAEILRLREQARQAVAINEAYGQVMTRAAAISAAARELDQKLEATGDPKAADRLRSDLQSQLFAIRKLQDAPGQHLTNITTIASEMDATRTRIRTARTARMEEEKRKRAEEERLALVSAEMAEVDAFAKTLPVFMAQMSFAKVAGKAKDKLKTLETEDARRQMDAIEQRFSRLAQWQTAIITRLANDAKKLKNPAQTIMEDVQGADISNLYLRGRPPVAWSRIDADKLARVSVFVFTSSGTATEKADGLLSTALYFNDAGRTDLAGKFRDQALKLNPSLQPEAERLLVPAKPK
jgi:serine/threonine protein kinase